MEKTRDVGQASWKETRWPQGSGGNLVAFSSFFLQSLVKSALLGIQKEKQESRRLRWKNTPKVQSWAGMNNNEGSHHAFLQGNAKPSISDMIPRTTSLVGEPSAKVIMADYVTLGWSFDLQVSFFLIYKVRGLDDVNSDVPPSLWCYEFYDYQNKTIKT